MIPKTTGYNGLEQLERRGTGGQSKKGTEIRRAENTGNGREPAAVAELRGGATHDARYVPPGNASRSRRVGSPG